MGQRQSPHPLLDMAEFRALGAQEAASGRRVVEQVVDLDRGTGRMRRRHRLTDLATIRLDLPRGISPGAARRERQSRNRADTRQRFAAKSERGDGFEVVEAGNLARGVTRQGQLEFVAFDALAVIADPHQLLSAGDDLDLHGLGAGVEAVLDQFLDHRGRALDDLAGSDLVDEVTGELLDGHPGDYAGAALRRTGRAPVSRR